MTTKQTVSFVFLGIALIFAADAMDPDRGGKEESTMSPGWNPAAEGSTVNGRKKELPGGYGPAADASKARNAMALANKEFVQHGFLYPGKMTVPEEHTGAGAGSAAAPSPPVAVVPAGSMVNTTGLTPSSVAQTSGSECPTYLGMTMHCLTKECIGGFCSGESCETDWYGEHCVWLCTHNPLHLGKAMYCANPGCGKYDGKCEGPCLNGWHGEYCTKPCTHWGAPMHCRTPGCTSDGECPLGLFVCKDGWHGEYCTKPCTHRGKPMHCINPGCTSDGECPLGVCKDGYNGDYCSEEVKST